jgi:PAS domain S-box-containing protein
MDSGKLIQAAFDAIEYPIQIVDRDFRIVLINQSTRTRWRDMGVNTDTVIGKTYWEALPFVPESDIEYFKEVFRSGKATVTEQEFSVDGEPAVIEVHRAPIISGGRVTHIVNFTRVITEQHLLQLSVRQSEETAKALLDASTEMMFLVTRDGTILALNETAAARLGKKVEELRGQSGDGLIPVDMRERLQKALADVFADGSPVRYRDSAGEVVLDISLRPVLNAGDISQAVAIHIRDLTEHEHMILALRQSDETARALLNATTESMILIEPDGRVVTMNEIAAARLNRTVEETIGVNGTAIFPPEVWEARLALMRKVIATRLPERFSDRRFGRTMEVSMYPVLDGQGEVNQLAVFAQDVTEREEALAALRESEERLRLQYANLPIPAFRWEAEEDDFVLRDCNDAAIKETKGNAPRVFGIKATDLYSDRHDIIIDMRRALRERSAHFREMKYRFRLSETEMTLIAHYVFVPPRNVMVYTIDLTEQRKAEATVQAVHQRLQLLVDERTRELADANELLRIERESLHQKNIALQEIIEQASRSRNSLALEIQSNIEHIVTPILDRLDAIPNETTQRLARIARASLMDIMSPFASSLDLLSRQLTAREIDLCNLIRLGYSTKEIAEMRSTSVQTVLTQRKIVRRKLNLQRKKTNLAAFLASMNENNAL